MEDVITTPLSDLGIGVCVFRGGRNIRNVSTDQNGEVLLRLREIKYNSIFSNKSDSDVLERGILYPIVLVISCLV